MKFDQFDIINDRYKLVQLIGHGGFSSVWRAQDLLLPETEDCVLKISNVDGSSPLRYEYLVGICLGYGRGLRTNNGFFWNHDINIVKPYHFEKILGSQREFIVYPYAGQSLAEVIDNWKKDPTSANSMPYFFGKLLWDVGCALRIMHERGFIHGDVKPTHIFLQGKTPGIFLGDLGIAESTSEELIGYNFNNERFDIRPVVNLVSITGVVQLTDHRLICTPMYSAPEVWEEKHKSPAYDIFSLGVTLFETLALTTPPIVSDSGKYIWKESSIFPELPPFVPSKVIDLIKHCLSIDPLKRPTAADVCEFALTLR